MVQNRRGPRSEAGETWSPIIPTKLIISEIRVMPRSARKRSRAPTNQPPPSIS